MNILTFTSLYPNNVWPLQGVFIQERMTRVAARTNGAVKVVAPVPYFPPLPINHRWRFSQVARHELRAGLEVYHPRYVMTPKLGMSLYGGLMFASVLRSLARIRAAFEFDVIDAHFVYPDGFAAVLLGRVLAKPVIVSARGSDITLYKDFPVIRRLLRWTLSRADRLVAVSRDLKDLMTQLDAPREKITIIPNGVDMEKFSPAPKLHARRMLGLPDTPLVLSVGHLAPVKGFALLIHAFKKLREEHHTKDARLVIVGEGAERPELEQLISRLDLASHVSLVGAKPHAELPLWYSAADVFCLASSREGWPNVLLESLACGTPVVATAVGGIPEILCSERLGLLTPRSAKELACGMATALRTPWRADMLRQHAQQHSWDRTAQLVLQTFEAARDAREGCP